MHILAGGTKFGPFACSEEFKLILCQYAHNAHVYVCVCVREKHIRSATSTCSLTNMRIQHKQGFLGGHVLGHHDLVLGPRSVEYYIRD
jgi:hypothetical protein